MKLSFLSRPLPRVRRRLVGSASATLLLSLPAGLLAATTPAATVPTETPALRSETIRVSADQPSTAEAVNRELQRQFPRLASRVEAQGDDGRVTLRGEVSRYPDRQRVQDLVEGIEGVSEVNNELTVKPRSQVPDGDIASNIRSTLANDPGTANLGLEVKVQDGAVTLSGTVETDPQRRVAGFLAARIRGVRELDNRIAVDPVDRSDADIRQQLQDHFATSAIYDDDRIDVSVSDGAVRLSGNVDSAREKTWAQLDAWVPGVRAIDTSDLQAKRSPAPLRTVASAQPPSDADIREAIHQLFVYDPRVSSMRPEIEVRDGLVTLSGAVGTVRAKEAAAQIARHTGGVSDVVNQLEVQPAPSRTDEQIRASLRAAFRSNAVVEASQIDVKVSDGRAVLEGRVEDTFEKWTAGDVAERTPGVTKVDNQINVTGESPALAQQDYFYPTGQSYSPVFPAPRHRAAHRADDQLAQDVRDQLRIHPLTHGEPVRVSVDEDVVTLSGDVASSVARRAAAVMAYGAGAKDVVNHLDLRGTPRSISAATE